MSVPFEYQLPFLPDIDPVPEASHPPRPPVFLDSAVARRLSLVVEQLAGTDGPTVIVGFPTGLPGRPRDAVDVELEPRGDESLTDLLLGITFPNSWRAVAVAGACRWFSTDGAGNGGEGRVAVALDRAGRSSTALASEGRSVTMNGSNGRILDLMRLGFGLDTAPPDGSPSDFLQAVWLDRIIDRASWDRSLDWLDLEDLQPFLGPDPTWADVRQAVAVGDLVVPNCSAGLARWFDVGAFARAVPDLLPPDRDLLSAVVDLLPPVLAGLVCDSLGQDW